MQRNVGKLWYRSAQTQSLHKSKAGIGGGGGGGGRGFTRASLVWLTIKDALLSRLKIFQVRDGMNIDNTDGPRPESNTYATTKATKTHIYAHNRRYSRRVRHRDTSSPTLPKRMATHYAPNQKSRRLKAPSTSIY